MFSPTAWPPATALPAPPQPLPVSAPLFLFAFNVAPGPSARHPSFSRKTSPARLRQQRPEVRCHSERSVPSLLLPEIVILTISVGTRSRRISPQSFFGFFGICSGVLQAGRL